MGTFSIVQSYVFPGGLQPQQIGPAVLSWTNAFPGIAAPQHGLPGKARSFNGSSDCITTPTGIVSGGSSTIAGWFNETSRLSGAGNPAAAHVLWSANGAGSIFNEISLDNGNLKIAYQNFGWNDILTILPLNTWTHIAVAADSSNYFVYVNGVQVYTIATTAFAIRQNPIILCGWSGDPQTTPASSGFFAGSAADFAVWNIKLTPTQIANLAAGRRANNLIIGANANLVSYLPIVGTSPEYDYSGNGRNGISTGTAVVSLPPALDPRVTTGAQSYLYPGALQPLQSAQILTPSLYSDPDTFYAPTVAGNAQTLTPALYTDPDSFFAPVVTKFGFILPSLFVDPDTIFNPTITAKYTITPSIFSDPDTIFTPTLLSVSHLTPAIYTDPDSFFAPTLSKLAHITPGIYSDPDTFFAPVFTLPNAPQTVTPGLFSDTPDTFFAPTIIQARFITPGLYSDPDVIFTPIVTHVAPATLTPNLYVNPDIFYLPQFVAGGGSTLLPEGFESQVGVWRQTGKGARTGKRYRIYTK